MASALAAVWAEERSEGLARLDGSRVRARLPVREPLMAWLIASAPLPSAVRGVGVRPLAGSRVLVEADVQVFGFRKRLETILRVDEPMSAGPPRTIRLAFEGRSLLSSAASLAGSVFGGFGSGVAVRDGVVTIDVDRLAWQAGVADLARHLRRLRMTTAADALWIDVDAEVEAGPASRMERRDSTSAEPTPRRDIAPPQDLTALLAGLHVEATARLAESLANAAIEAIASDWRATDGAPAAISSNPATDWVEILRRAPAPRVRFEPGVMVVEADVRL